MNKKVNKTVSRAIVFMVMLCMVMLCMVGCDSHNQFKCLESVEKKFPKSDVAMIPNEKFRFIVKKDSGEIWYVETMNQTNNEVSQASKIFY